jgi:hypothetical protein
MDFNGKVEVVSNAELCSVEKVALHGAGRRRATGRMGCGNGAENGRGRAAAAARRGCWLSVGTPLGPTATSVNETCPDYYLNMYNIVAEGKLGASATTQRTGESGGSAAQTTCVFQNRASIRSDARDVSLSIKN